MLTVPNRSGSRGPSLKEQEQRDATGAEEGACERPPLQVAHATRVKAEPAQQPGLARAVRRLGGWPTSFFLRSSAKYNQGERS